MKDTAVVFHWWNDNVLIKPFEDTANPIVLAAACVRKNHPDVSMYVVDCSICQRPDTDWRHFPYKYKFKVIKRNPFLGEIPPETGRTLDYRLLSRVWDVEIAMRDAPEPNILFLDSDIFCIGPLEPAPVEYPEFFYANFNNGVWFYNKESRSTKVVFDYWKGMICRSIHDLDFRHELYAQNKGYGTFFIQDEIIYRSLCIYMPNHVRNIDMRINYLLHWLYVDPPEVVKDVRGLHCLHFISGQKRKRLFLVIKELWDQVVWSFDKHDYKMIFGEEVPEKEMMSLMDFYYSPKSMNRFYELMDIKDKESIAFDSIIKWITQYDKLPISLL